MPVVLDVHQPKFRSMREQRPLRRNLGSTIARHANLYNSSSTVTQRRHPDNHLTRNDVFTLRRWRPRSTPLGERRTPAGHRVGRGARCTSRSWRSTDHQ